MRDARLIWSVKPALCCQHPLTPAALQQELYGCFVPAPILFPVACLGLGAQYLSLRELWYPSVPKVLAAGTEEDREGWAGLPDELLATVFTRLTMATPGLLLRWAGSCHLRLVCRSWRRVHDARACAFLKPAAFHSELIAARFPALRSLDLSRCKYPDVIGVRELLARLRSLATLTAKDVGVGPRLALALAEALTTAPALRSLNLSSNGVGRGAAAFADALRMTNCNLASLNLRDNALGAAGVAELAEALRHNSSLTELDLSANPGCGSAGAVALGAALVRNETLRSLNLGGCALGDDGAIALAQGLAGARGLRRLSLFTNAISDSGAAELARGAARGELTELELRGNPAIGAAGVRACAEAAAANPKLKAVHLDVCSGGVAGRSPIRQAAASAPPSAQAAAAAADMAAAVAELASALRLDC